MKTYCKDCVYIKKLLDWQTDEYEEDICSMFWKYIDPFDLACDELVERGGKKRLFGDIITQARIDKDLSLHEASELIGISIVFLSELECNIKKASKYIIAKMAKIYGLNFDVLLSIMENNFDE